MGILEYTYKWFAIVYQILLFTFPLTYNKAELSFLYLQERVHNHCKENRREIVRTSDSRPIGSATEMAGSRQDGDKIETLSSSDEEYDWQPAESQELDNTFQQFSRRFQCLYDKNPGHLHLTMDGLGFATMGTEHVRWQYGYHEITEMRKLDKSDKSGYKAPKGLQFHFADGVKEEVVVSKGRDEIFNVIIGLSGRRWQQLPSLK